MDGSAHTGWSQGAGAGHTVASSGGYSASGHGGGHGGGHTGTAHGGGHGEPAPVPSGPTLLPLLGGPGDMAAVAQTHIVDLKKNGFEEHHFRLLFRWQEDFRNTLPKLITILPDGTVETETICHPGETGGCIAFGYHQSLNASCSKEQIKLRPSKGDRWPKEPYGDLVEALVFPRPDGSGALVQVWPTQFNEEWKKRFYMRQKANENPPPGITLQAYYDFAIAMERLWCNKDCLRKEDVSQRILDHIDFCKSDTQNSGVACISRGENLLKFLSESQEARVIFGIKSVDDSGFETKITYPKKPALDANNKTKHFTVPAETIMVLYIKEGWEKMACVKDLEQFNKECDFK